MSIRPKYLILDEVLSGLDLISADAVMRVLEQYHREFDCAFLLITHDMDSACPTPFSRCKPGKSSVLA